MCTLTPRGPLWGLVCGLSDGSVWVGAGGGRALQEGKLNFLLVLVWLRGGPEPSSALSSRLHSPLLLPSGECKEAHWTPCSLAGLLESVSCSLDVMLCFCPHVFGSVVPTVAGGGLGNVGKATVGPGRLEMEDE